MKGYGYLIIGIRVIFHPDPRSIRDRAAADLPANFTGDSWGAHGVSLQ
jgi:hypothetical protein